MKVTRDFESINPHRLYKDSNRGVISGVCAGIAQYFNISVMGVRLGFCLGMIFFSPLFLLAYIVLALSLKPKPALIYRSHDDEIFWRNVSFQPKDTFAMLRHKFRKLNTRLQRLEEHVTSTEYELNQKFKEL